jgi:hypothetical protein
VIAVMSGQSSVRVVAQTLEVFQSALEFDRDKALRFRPQNCAQSKQRHQIKMNTPKNGQIIRTSNFLKIASHHYLMKLHTIYEFCQKVT